MGKCGVYVRIMYGSERERGEKRGKRGKERERQERDEAHAESYDAAQLAVRVREIDRCREHTSTV